MKPPTDPDSTTDDATPKKKAAKAPKADPAERVQVQRKTPMQWAALLQQQEAQNWRTLRVTIQIRNRLYAGSPAALDAARAMIAARGLDDVLEAVKQHDPAALKMALEAHGLGSVIDVPIAPMRVGAAGEVMDPTATEAAAAAAEVSDAGLCVFHRRDGRPGIWLPANNIKAGIKENWSVLGFRNEIRGSRGALAEGVFVYGVGEPGQPVDARGLDWVYLGEKPDGVDVAVSHTTGPKGPVSSIKRHEYRIAPTLVFDIRIALAGAVAEKFDDAKLADMLVHFGEHGVGACRSQGNGRFSIVSIEEVDGPAVTVVTSR